MRAETWEDVEVIRMRAGTFVGMMDLNDVLTDDIAKLEEELAIEKETVAVRTSRYLDTMAKVERLKVAISAHREKLAGIHVTHAGTMLYSELDK